MADFMLLAKQSQSAWDILTHEIGGFLTGILVFIFAVIIGIVFVYPLVKYLYCRIYVLFVCNVLLSGKSKGAFMFKSINPLSPIIPSWLIHKPDFVLYSKGVTYVVKLHSFFSGRKKIVFTSNERWAFTRQARKKKFDAVFEKKYYAELKTKPAPEYMTGFTRILAKEIDGPCVPVMLHAPSVKFLQTKNGVVMNNGDYTFYGMVISDIKHLSSKLSANANSENFPQRLTSEEKHNAAKAIAEAVKKV